jgi:hypothetical protein
MGLCAGLDCEERFADWGADEVTLELANLVRDRFNFGSPPSSDSLIALFDCLCLLLSHALLDFGSLREVGRRDGESDIPFWVPLVSWQAIFLILLLKHLIATIFKNRRCIITLEHEENSIVVRISLHFVHDVVIVVGRLRVVKAFLQESTQSLLDDRIDRVHVHIVFYL